MGAPPMIEIGRREFQARAFEFIRREGGPERLSASIEARLKKIGAERCIVDGIRHLSTYENLTLRFGGGVGLIFVQTPADVAYDMYRAREAQGCWRSATVSFLKSMTRP
jgi:hypothetical protein